MSQKPPSTTPKILVFDIETSPIVARVWRVWGENILHKQIIEDWYMISWAAKWLGSPANQVMYMDSRRQANYKDDKRLTQGLLKLINEADVVIAHNGIKFDQRKFNSRVLFNKLKPPHPVKMIDTRLLAKQRFGFTHNSLEHLTHKLNTKYKKYDHQKFPGIELWVESLEKRNQDAWRELEKYNKFDVLALEELYQLMAAWDNTSFVIFMDELRCKCGSDDVQKRGFAYTLTGKYQKYVCNACGHWTRDTKRIRNSSRTGVAR